MDREHRAAGLAVKDICLYPLRRDVQQELCRNAPQDRHRNWAAVAKASSGVP
jgi:hypothetical protein